MKNFFIAALSVLLCISMAAQAQESSQPLLKTLDQVKADGYFDTLDYSDITKVSQIVKMTDDLVRNADQALNLTSKDPYFKKSGLIFVYAALALDNVILGHRDGFISDDQFNNGFKSITHNNEGELHEGMKMRILLYLEKALIVVPTDRRIRGWYYGMKARYDDPKYMENIIDMLDKEEDAFYLITALTTMPDVPVTRDQLAVVDRVTHKMTKIFNPCIFGKKADRKQCRSTEITPFSSQGGLIVMADQRLKIAAREKTAAARWTGKMISRFMYTTTHLFWMRKTTPLWKHKNIIHERQRLTYKEQFTEDEINEYMKTRNGKVAMQCSACHSQ